MAYEEEDTHREANTHAIADTAVNGGVASPALAKSKRIKSYISVIVPTVDRGFLLTDFCSIDITGLKPDILSTSGRSKFPKNCRA